MATSDPQWSLRQRQLWYGISLGLCSKRMISGSQSEKSYPVKFNCLIHRPDVVRASYLHTQGAST